jgi:hypothetical protein
MKAKIRIVEYFYVTVRDEPGEACRVLQDLACAEVNLLAFAAIPLGTNYMQLVVFPEHPQELARAAEQGDLALVRGQRAFLVQGDDRLGALIDIHHRLREVNVNVISSNGVADGRGGYGFVLHVRPEEFERAALVLEVP